METSNIILVCIVLIVLSNTNFLLIIVFILKIFLNK